MNSERRHELQENILANYIVKLNKSIDPYSKPIAVGVAALLFGGIGYALYNGKVSGERSDATLNLIRQASSNDPDAIAMVRAEYPGTPASSWASLYQGSQLLAQGSRALYQNRLDAEDQLNAAAKAFRNALADGNDPLLRSRASYGLARVSESLGNIEEAIEAYEKCASTAESKEMAEACENRIKALSSESTKEFLTWFAAQDFSPADPSAPPSLPSGSVLPDLPDLDLPDLELDGSESDKEPTNDKLSMPEDSAAVKDSDSADDGASNEDQPAEEKKPESEPTDES